MKVSPVAYAHVSYSRASKPLILDNISRRYILTVHDKPESERPREKMLAGGASALSTKELLAVLLNTGTVKEDVLTMSARLIKEYGEGSILHARNPEKLAQDASIPLGKAMQIVAASELGRRFFEKNGSSSPLRTAQDVFEYVKDMRDLKKEQLRGIYLNTHFKIVHDEIISIGTLDANIVHPREVFRPALEYCAVAVILVHNHPSGETAASPADIQITRQLIEAGATLGIDLIDHMIVTHDAFASVPAEYRI